MFILVVRPPVEPKFSATTRNYPLLAQPPLPLQEFFPLQPLSLVLQPPCPLHSFWPLHECLPASAMVCVCNDTPACEVMLLAA